MQKGQFLKVNNSFFELKKDFIERFYWKREN